MKKIFYLSFLALVFFSQCTPKTGDLAKKPAEMKDKKEEMVEVKKKDFRSMAPEAGPAPKIQLGTYEQFELANGLKVIVVENHKLPRVTFSLSLDIDPFMENEFSGTASMAGQLMMHGTKTKTKAQLDEEVDFMGATLNTSSNGMYAASLTKHTDNLLAVMSDVLMNPSFPQEEFEKVKKQTLSSLATSKDDANAIANNVGNVLAYGKGHPYGEVVTEETVEHITLDKTKEFYNKYMHPNVGYLIVTGDITPSEAKVLTKKYFEKWKPAKVPTSSFPLPAPPSETTIDFVNKSGAVQSVINVTYPLELKPGSQDAIKARVMNTLLGGFFRSRLNGNLREDKGYTYGIRSSLNSDKEIGSFSASAGVRNEVTDSSIIEILAEFNRLRTEVVPADELALVKNYLSGSFARSLESPQTVARFARNTIRYNLPKDYYANYLENLSKVTSADIMAMAKKYIKPENAHIVVVGNKGEVLEKLEKIGKVNLYDNYGNEVNDEFVIPDGTTAETVIEDYLNAIGGNAKLSKVTDLSQTMSADMGGQKLTVDIHLMDGKFASIMSMGSMGVMGKQVYNNGKAYAAQMGQVAPVDEATTESLKEGAVLFKEMKYAKLGYKVKLNGAEKIDGKDAYVVEVSTPSGNKETHYYDVETSLKVREVSFPGGQAMTTDMTDYKAVDGIMFPHVNVISGMGPGPLKMIVTEIKINKGIDDSVFATE